MKKAFILIVSFIILSFSLANAQDLAFCKGDNVLNAGLGFSSGWSNTKVPPVSLSYENGIYQTGEKTCIGVGGFMGTSVQKGYPNDYVSWALCGQVTAHYSFNKSIDVYAGPFIGYISVGAANVSVGSLARGLLIGIRYYFYDNMGAYCQLGGFDTLNLGLAWRF